ncbi:RecQ family ATP-dependent DNA helicase [Subtercola endophyticus]|uniref:RecQ family ATP-dependent DNA helicase n=1 Tax=Subtercola endophyticus TaxID=2895559 RepID=UPI001E2D51E2|nr:RecQ family ATP-dependent DNA helicase [Subtercola endophyticus]UFS58065.1 RecQ family ATP-dependent DNA helicase [Subtercola endophyticus]
MGNATSAEGDHEVARVAREVFGWGALRSGLGEAMRTLIEGRDVLAIMPTGYGKSSIYEVTGTVLGGVTIVVSPLIALQEDQVRTLTAVADAPPAVAVNSSHGQAAARAAWRRIEQGRAGFIFLAPEQLANEDVRDRLRALPVRLFVVDEAHCVSSWGHDFRPDYLQLGDAIETLGHPPVLAMTATGASPVRDEIVERLGLTNHRLIARGFDRPNLHLAVVRHETDADKRRSVREQVERLEGVGLIYVPTRHDTQLYSGELVEAGIRSAGYNGGMPASEREEVYERFIADELDVVVATSAFGMGIDKSDVRFVVHAAVTDSIDSYYQEIGRAGRDGEAANVTLHYRPEDFALTSFFEGGAPDDAQVRRMFGAIAEHPGLSRAELATELDTHERAITRLLGLLEDAGVVVAAADGLTAATATGTAVLGTAVPGTAVPGTAVLDTAVPGTAVPASTGPASTGLGSTGTITADEAVARTAQHAASRQRVEHSRAAMMREYAETRSCRRQVLLGYFGENLPEPCGNCDTCDSGSAYEHAESTARASFAVDEHVTHASWGDGVVMRVEADRITVFFEREGYRVLSIADATRFHLLSVTPSAPPTQ